jgi:hypothetical protein
MAARPHPGPATYTQAFLSRDLPDELTSVSWTPPGAPEPGLHTCRIAMSTKSGRNWGSGMPEDRPDAPAPLPSLLVHFPPASCRGTLGIGKAIAMKRSLLETRLRPPILTRFEAE